MTNYEFWLAVIDRTVPIIDAFFKILMILAIPFGSYLAVKTRALEKMLGEARAEVGVVQTQVGELHKEVNGKMAVLLEEKDQRVALAERVGKAEGKAEVLEHNAVPVTPAVLPVVVPPVVPRDPEARTRKTDREPPLQETGC